MAETRKASDIGIGKAKVICSMPADQRLEFIAQGLPILFESAKSLVMASQALKQFPREAEILGGHCAEECAKILILVDIIRCPKKRAAERLGPMMKWFYDHLARLIYAKAQGWKPVNARQLQEYIDSDRQSHYLEGEYDELIMPNWELFARESSLYADVMVEEDGESMWHSPVRVWEGDCRGNYLPTTSFRVVEALEAFGVFTIEGLKIMAEVWGKHDVEGEVGGVTLTRDLYLKLAKRLETAGLIREHATREHEHDLINNWQLPMYNMDFSMESARLEELRDQREANLPYNW
jgi:hypothetical protein